MKNLAAFAFVEFLIVLIIAALVLGLSFPALQSVYMRAQDEAIQEQWLSSLSLAKQAANAYHATISIAKNETWSQGWNVFIDNDQTGEIKDKTSILSHITFTTTHHRLQWHAYPYYRDYLSFQPNFSLGEAEGVLWCCHAREQTAHWAIMINRATRARVLTEEESLKYPC